MKVHVVMGNDFPAAVFKSDSGAKKFCEDRKKEDVKNLTILKRRGIHWRTYEFELQE